MIEIICEIRISTVIVLGNYIPIYTTAKYSCQIHKNLVKNYYILINIYHVRKLSYISWQQKNFIPLYKINSTLIQQTEKLAPNVIINFTS